MNSASSSPASPESGIPGLQSGLGDGGTALPRRVGDYELLSEIARGGMGVVFRARQISLKRAVAVKMIRDSVLASPKAVQRFRLEAEAVAQLHHPNIVPIFEFGEMGGHWFLSMGLVEGGDLSRTVCGVPMAARPLATLMSKLAHTVHYAHQRRVLHRDLKPANILLDAEGEPHVTDFGLAKITDPDGVVTHSLDIVGSPNYMAPEQVSEQATQLTTATDIYSLGAVMYELLSGRAPFRANTPVEVLRKVLDEEPQAPRSLYRFADPDLETICLKCMEKDPSRRYGSAEALAEDLERWLHDEPILARPASVVERVRKWMRRNPRVATLVVLLHLVGLIGLLGILGMSARATANARQSREQMLRLDVATGNRLIEANEDFAGVLWLAEALRLERGDSVRKDNHRYRLESALRNAPRLEEILWHGDWTITAAFSPDGHRLVTAASDRTARLWDLPGGTLHTPPLAHEAQVHVARFDHTGRRVLTMDSAGHARIWNAETGAPLTPSMRPDDFDRNAIPNGARKLPAIAFFSPDETRVVTAFGSRAAHVWDAATGQHLLALPHADTVHHARYHTNGRWIVTSGSDKTARVWDAQTGRPLSAPLAHDQFVGWAEFGPDDRLLLTTSGRSAAHLWDWTTGREISPALTHPDSLFAASLSPDGRRVLTACWDMVARVWDTATGLCVARLYHPGGLETAVFSPDGQWIATGCDDGIARIWPTEGAELPEMSLPSGGHVSSVAFSADARKLAVCTWNGSTRVWDLTPRGSLARTFHAPEAYDARFDAQADRVLTVGIGTNGEARVWNPKTGEPISPPLRHTQALQSATWSHDFQRVLTASDDRTARVWDAATGRERNAPFVHPGVVREAWFSNDDRWVITACEDGSVRVWDPATGKQTTEFKHPGACVGLEASPTEPQVATIGDDQNARVWKLPTGEPATPPLALPYRALRLHYSPDGSRIVVASESQGPGTEGGAATVWDAHTGQRIGAVLRHQDDVVDAEFSRDGRTIVTASSDATARVWDARRGDAITPALPHRSGVVQAVFTPDGFRVATVTIHGVVRLWDARTGEPITAPLPHPHRHDIGRLSFSPDGHRLLIATGADEVFLREFPRNETDPNDLLLQARVLSANRIDDAGNLQPLGIAEIGSAWQALRAAR